MDQGILLEASPVAIIGGIIFCMFVVPFIINLLFNGIKDKKNEGVILFWIFVILAVVMIIMTVKECSSFDIPFNESRHT